MPVLVRREDGFDVGQYQFLKNFIVIGVKAMGQYYSDSNVVLSTGVMVPCWWIADWSQLIPPSPVSKWEKYWFSASGLLLSDSDCWVVLIPFHMLYEDCSC